MIKSECRSMQKPTGYNTHKKNIITYFSLVRPQFYYFFFFKKVLQVYKSIVKESQ